MTYTPSFFDALGLIYAHFPSEKRAVYHKTLAALVRSGGYIILEAFSKNNLTYLEKYPNIGGPKVPELLYSTDEIKSDFEGFEIIELEEQEIQLQEGLYHNGIGSVIRFVGKKK